jgi:hypothetical protein
MVFSVNQVRQLYVADAVQGTAKKTDGVVVESDAAGTIALKADAAGKNLYFLYRGATGLMRSDAINIDNILSVQTVSADAASQKHALKEVTVKLDSEVNEGNPVSGQDYILRITINPYVGMSDEEPYLKYGAVHATRSMTPAKFYAKMAASLYKNFSRELGKMLEFSVNGKTIGSVKYNEAGEEVIVDTTGAEITLADDYVDGVKITEVEQEWVLGIKEQTYVNFVVTPTKVTYDGEEVTWGTTTTSESSTVRGNGRKIADLEYFCMGERGDQYRNIGWPNVIPTKYLADPDVNYNIFNVHYAFVDGGESPQRSEKDITVVCANKSNLNKLIGQFATASKVDVSELV